MYWFIYFVEYTTGEKQSSLSKHHKKLTIFGTTRSVKAHSLPYLWTLYYHTTLLKTQLFSKNLFQLLLYTLDYSALSHLSMNVVYIYMDVWGLVTATFPSNSAETYLWIQALGRYPFFLTFFMPFFLAFS